MKPSTFFAIFIPIAASIVSLLFLVFNQNKKPSPRYIRTAFVLTFIGVLLLGGIYIIKSV